MIYPQVLRFANLNRLARLTRCSSSMKTEDVFTRNFENIIVKRSESGKVAIIELNRPKALNALCTPLFEELNFAFKSLDSDNTVSAFVLTGSAKAFAAGADIREMKEKDFDTCYQHDYLAQWNVVAKLRKPIVAAVRGYALGGGCELAMMCDIVYSGDTAVFGQPEVKLGVPPGAGGTQRLVRSIGKSKAMEMVLSGHQIKADEAERNGLVARVFPDDLVVTKAIALCDKIASMSPTAVRMAKELVNSSYETTLSQGLLLERRLFHAAFSTYDQKEGMGAFLEKREPIFDKSQNKK